MNTNTGQIYEQAYYSDGTFGFDEKTRAAMQLAEARGDKIVEVSPRVAKLMKEALKSRQRRARKRREMQKASRRANRR